VIVYPDQDRELSPCDPSSEWKDPPTSGGPLEIVEDVSPYRCFSWVMGPQRKTPLTTPP